MSWDCHSLDNMTTLLSTAVEDLYETQPTSVPLSPTRERGQG